MKKQMIKCIEENMGFTVGKEYEVIRSRELSRLNRIQIIDNRGKAQDFKVPDVYNYFE